MVTNWWFLLKSNFGTSLTWKNCLHLVTKKNEITRISFLRNMMSSVNNASLQRSSWFIWLVVLPIYFNRAFQKNIRAHHSNIIKKHRNIGRTILHESFRCCVANPTCRFSSVLFLLFQSINKLNILSTVFVQSFYSIFI